MNFDRPGMLLLLWILPLVAGLMIYAHASGRRRRGGLSNHRCSRGLCRRLSARDLWIKGTLVLLGLAAIIVACARPRFGVYYRKGRPTGRGLLYLPGRFPVHAGRRHGAQPAGAGEIRHPRPLEKTGRGPRGPDRFRRKAGGQGSAYDRRRILQHCARRGRYAQAPAAARLSATPSARRWKPCLPGPTTIRLSCL